MINFDEKGHLYPYEILETTLTEFETVFVQQMEDQAHRKRIFDGYLQFIDNLKTALNIPFFQWINGSFTTQKQFPGDIDVCTFIDYDHFVRNLPLIEHFHAISKSQYFTDAHFASTCKWNHRFYNRAVSDEQYWKNVFGFSRPDENMVRHPKGILKIKF